MSFAFLIKLGIVCSRAATLLRRWSFVAVLLKKKTVSVFIVFKAASFRYIFQIESVVSSFYSKVAV